MNASSDRQPVPKGSEQSVLKRFATKLCISITLAIGLLAAVECAFYLQSPPPLVPPTDYKAYVVWQVARPVLKTVTVDAEGLRRTYNSHCDAGEYTIWMFGGSGMWGESFRDSETLASLVAKHYEDSGRPVCVKNYGQVGWVNTQEIIKLLLELKRAARKPDSVIFYDGTVDSFLPYESDEVDVHWSFPVFKKKFESGKAGDQAGFEYLQSTNTYVGLQRIVDSLNLVNKTAAVRRVSAEEAASMARRTLDNYTKNLEILDALAAHYGFQYACFWEPWLESAPKPLSPVEELIKKKEERTNPGILEVWRATYELFSTVKRPHLVNLSDIFRERNDTIFVDRSHLTPEGGRIVADRITQVLQHPGS